MSGDSSEEKTLPPTAQKLRKAREKGQVVNSPETIASATTLIVLAWLYLRRESIWADLVTLFAVAPDPDLPFALQLTEALRASGRLALGLVAPIVAGVIAFAILLGMAISGGPLISFHPLTPDFSKLNPAGGFKKIFGRAALMRFLMHVIRASAILAVLGMILWGQIGAMLPTPPCGLECAGRTARSMLVPLLIACAAILILAALFDYLVQRANFLRDQRMSITEYKREHKDQEGDPMLRGHLRGEQRAMVERPTGLAQATVVLTDGRRRAVGIRYRQDDTPAPLVVVRARGRLAVARLVAAARVPVHDDPRAIELLAPVPVGQWIAEDEQINAIAGYLG